MTKLLDRTRPDALTSVVAPVRAQVAAPERRRPWRLSPRCTPARAP